MYRERDQEIWGLTLLWIEGSGVHTPKDKYPENLIGYSDHTLGIEVPIAAVALGARIIEKHFTLDRNLPGPDHAASLEPDELKAMVIAIRNIELAISGDGVKKPSGSEIKNISIARKSIHLNKNLSKDLNLNFTNISEENLSQLFSGNFLPVGSNSIAQAYAGHQFGNFTMLGENVSDALTYT
jgi:sialic acid synthase SpsE